jgi:hypothetical protein
MRQLPLQLFFHVFSTVIAGYRFQELSIHYWLDLDRQAIFDEKEVEQ